MTPSTTGSRRLLVDEPAARSFIAASLGMDPGTASIEFLSGGVSSAVVRVVADGDCFVVKQALPRLRVEAIWLSRPERSGIEARCAGVLDRLVPGSVPRVMRVVPEAHAFVMECANFAPFRGAVRRATGLPVFDLYTLGMHAYQVSADADFPRR